MADGFVEKAVPTLARADVAPRLTDGMAAFVGVAAQPGDQIRIFDHAVGAVNGVHTLVGAGKYVVVVHAVAVFADKVHILRGPVPKIMVADDRYLRHKIDVDRTGEGRFAQQTRVVGIGL